MNTTADTTFGPPGRLGRVGEALRRHRGAIAAVQWTMVAVYAVLVVVPAFLPLPAAGTRLVDSLVLVAQFAFWGLWWPFVMASVLLFGRAWCGLLCPEGTLTEWASRHGLGRPIPRWLRWGGWPAVAFVATTVYGQLVSVYDYAAAALLVLGGSTLAAMAVGFVWGKGRRVWCRYLCPASGVFALLARLAPLHFGVDEARWRAHVGATPRVTCAPLLDLRHLHSAAGCHACGRCSGHRGAIALRARAIGAEVRRGAAVGAWDARLLLWGVLGVATGAFHWSLSPEFVAARQAGAEWLVEHGALWALSDDLPWWLLTHWPEAGDRFTVLDGAAILGFIAVHALLIGGVSALALRAAARLLGDGSRRHELALALLPIAAVSLLLGLSLLTLGHLRAEGVATPWLAPLRATLLTLGSAGSLALAWRLCEGAPLARRLAALACTALPVTGLVALWVRALLA